MLDRQLSDGDYTECTYWIENDIGLDEQYNLVPAPQAS
ncbi:hypothetical protein TELCIR_18597 [Teladorsagia circumcincta]|uniref:Uncharacterized protein n=1 Tax=Teladorsagia circumcincta TaxID=45464 RepID=A0A2G9TPJ9_TELCI|nr:hypothetical protein TELCIR_18597 [Teladorsagia circumcincta]